MNALEASTPSDFVELAAKHQTNGFPLLLEKTYGRYIRVTMRHNDHLISTVIRPERLGVCVRAMRNELNKGNFCPTCGALR